jgi:sugar lactone lactonase YvrE
VHADLSDVRSPSRRFALMSHVRVIEAAGRCRLGEGPLWSVREQALYWVDILGQTAHRLRVADGEVTHWPMPEIIAWLIERESAPGFVAGLTRDVVFLTLEPVSIVPLARPESQREDHRLNDAKADAAGRLWCGTMPVGGDRETGALFRVDADGSLSHWDGGYRVTNGPAFSPDGRYLYHTDSIGGTVFRFALGTDGAITDRQPFIRFAPGSGVPDGMTVDADGGLWIAVWGGSRVCRYTPDGRLDRSIALPASQITSCAFGGPRLDRLYVTSASEGVVEPYAGALFEIDVDTVGLPAHRFAG